MSGIAALFSLTDHPVQMEYLEGMMRPLRSLGSGNPVYYRESKLPLALGCDLKAITPEDDHETQPLVGEEGQRVMVMDGRLDNREEMAEKLGIPTLQLKTMPDSALILKAYERFGMSVWPNLAGDFVLVIWEKYKRRLICVRDSMGQRPVYYCKLNGMLAIANSPIALLTLPWIKKEPNMEMLADFGSFLTFERPHEYFLRHINRLPAGHVLEASSQEFRVWEFYWSTNPIKPIRFAQQNDYIEAFLEIFREVTRQQMRSKQPLSLLMSGGLDSTSIAAMVCQELKGGSDRLQVYTSVPHAGFETPADYQRCADEGAAAQTMAQRYPMLDLHLIRNDPQRSFLHGVETYFEHGACVIRNPYNRLWMDDAYQLASQRGGQVMLDGAWGNFSATWMGFSPLPQHLQSWQFGKSIQEIIDAFKHQRTPMRFLIESLVLPFAPQWMKQLALPMITDIPNKVIMGSPIKATWQDKLNQVERFRQRQFRTILEENRRFVTKLFLASYGSDLFNAARSIFGVENRSPLQNKQMVEFTYALPNEVFCRQGQQRLLIKNAMKSFLPPDILESTLRGKQSVDWFVNFDASQNHVKALLKAFRQSPTVSDLLDLEEMHRLVHSWPPQHIYSQKTDFDYKILLSKGVIVGLLLLWMEGKIDDIPRL